MAKATVSTNTFSSNNAGVTFQGQGITATVSTNTFSSNNAGVTFQGTPGDTPNAFKAVTLTGNDFANTLPASDTGVAICGVALGADDTTLTLGEGNQFPSTATCQQLEGVTQPGYWNLGTDLGLSGGLNQFALDCTP